MTKRLVATVVFLLVAAILGMGLGCAAPATPTPTVTPAPKVTPGVTPTEVAPGIKSTKVRFAQMYRPDYVTSLYIELFKKLVEERSGGKIKIDHYPAGQLFAQPDEYHAVGTGAVQMIVPSAAVLSAVHNRAWDIANAGVRYFKDEKAYDDFWAEPSGGGYIKPLLEKDGVKYLGFSTQATFLDYVVINNVRPIKKVEDWKGLKMATGVGQEWEVTCFGSSPIPLPNPEVLTALQTRMVDGRAVTMSGLLSAGWDKVTKYGTPYVNFGIRQMFPVLANLAWWNGLNDATRTMILNALKESQRWTLDDWVPKNDAPVLKQMQAAYGENFYWMAKQDPAEFERHRVTFAAAIGELMKKSLPPEMFNLAETKYKR